MTIRAICTASLLFFDSEDKTKPQITARALEIVELPDWVKDTTTFKVNERCGRIKVMNNGIEQKTIEKVQEDNQDLTVRQQSEKLHKEIARMKKSELQEYCKSHNISFKGDETNPELIDLIKSSIL